MGVDESISLVFLVVNILCVSSIVFALVLYYSIMNTSNLTKIKQTYTKLINSEKLAVLGQISAGVAHEINTPLGAIKSSAEESINGFEEFMTKLPAVLSSLTAEEKDFFVLFVSSISPQNQFLSTKEERHNRKILRTSLEDLGVSNPRFISDRLVQVGIYEITPEIEILAKQSNFDELVMIIYNLLIQQKNNKTISLAVDKASRIVLALKSYLHSSGNEEPEPVDIINNLETVLTIYNNKLKQGIDVVKEFKDVPKVMAISDKLNQVWTNLIINAIQAMDNKGKLTIAVKPFEDFVEISISDTGKGIPDEIQEKVFDPFFTTKSSGQGTGLGLDIIKNILTDHSGTISFESTVNVGTTFYVKLPINKS
jgi:signal transduction histidine kinase